MVSVASEFLVFTLSMVAFTASVWYWYDAGSQRRRVIMAMGAVTILVGVMRVAAYFYLHRRLRRTQHQASLAGLEGYNAGRNSLHDVELESYNADWPHGVPLSVQTPSLTRTRAYSNLPHLFQLHGVVLPNPIITTASYPPLNQGPHVGVPPPPLDYVPLRRQTSVRSRRDAERQRWLENGGTLFDDYA